MTPALWMALVPFVMPYLVHLVVVEARTETTYDTNRPRAQSASLEGWGARAWAAEQNAFEAAPPASVVFLIAHLTGVSDGWVLGAGAVWVAGRAVHAVAYVGDVPPARSIAFGVANLAIVAVVLAAAGWL